MRLDGKILPLRQRKSRSYLARRAARIARRAMDHVLRANEVKVDGKRAKVKRIKIVWPWERKEAKQ